jgi:hypothetical protein
MDRVLLAVAVIILGSLLVAFGAMMVAVGARHVMRLVRRLRGRGRRR